MPDTKMSPDPFEKDASYESVVAAIKASEEAIFLATIFGKQFELMK